MADRCTVVNYPTLLPALLTPCCTSKRGLSFGAKGGERGRRAEHRCLPRSAHTAHSAELVDDACFAGLVGAHRASTGREEAEMPAAVPDHSADK